VFHGKDTATQSYLFLLDLVSTRDRAARLFPPPPPLQLLLFLAKVVGDEYRSFQVFIFPINTRWRRVYYPLPPSPSERFACLPYSLFGWGGAPSSPPPPFFFLSLTYRIRCDVEEVE